MQKRTLPISSHLDRPSLFIKGLMTLPKRELLIAGATREISIEHDRPILLAWVANQNTTLASSQSLAD